MSAARRRRVPPEVAHAARVALAASLLLGIVYAACVAVLDEVVSARLVATVNARLAEQMSDVRETGLSDATENDDIDGTPVYLWRVTASGPVKESAGAPPIPATLHLAARRPTTVRLDGVAYQLYLGRARGRSLIAGQSLQSEDHLLALLRDGETLAAPVLLLAMFAGALIIGLRALSPVEQSRRRQLEFTADASHELRTPLSVISAETSVALSAPRRAGEYAEVLGRIRSENYRLQKIVEDLLWLARFDSAPPQPGYAPLDLATIATGCAERFRALAATRSFDIDVVTSDQSPAWISAPPEWIDRLAGVLVDNACRYAAASATGRPAAGSGDSGGSPPEPPERHRGRVRVSVAGHGNRVSLTVEDSGPGVPPESRARLFDRFHRSTQLGGSAGLGLAIADSIVRSTGGQWRLADSDLGGALFAVSWRRVSLRQHGASGSAPPRAGTTASQEEVQPASPARPASAASQPDTRSASPAEAAPPTARQ